MKISCRKLFEEIVGVVVCTSRVVKMKEHLPFVENSAHFVLKIELLLIVFSSFEREEVLKNSTF